MVLRKYVYAGKTQMKRTTMGAIIEQESETLLMQRSTLKSIFDAKTNLENPLFDADKFGKIKDQLSKRRIW